MSKEPDLNKLKEDFETLANDLKSVFGNLKNTVSDSIKSSIADELENKKHEFESHFKKIKNKIKDHTPESNTIKYIGIALVVGVVVGAWFAKKSDE